MSFPDVSEALWDWTDPVQMRVIKQNVQDFEVVETQEPAVVFDASLQPMKTQQLLVKPEGQRRWKWWVMVTEQLLDLDAVVIDAAGVKYRVAEKANWKAAGYYRYDVVEAPDPSATNPT